MYIQTNTAGNYNNINQYPNFKSIRLINELPFGRFPALAARSVIESPEIRNLASTLHKTGVDLVVLCKSTAELEILDTTGKRYPEFISEKEDDNYSNNEMDDTSCSIFNIRNCFCHLIKTKDRERSYEGIRRNAFKEIEQFNHHLDLTV